MVEMLEQQLIQQVHYVKHRIEPLFKCHKYSSALPALIGDTKTKSIKLKNNIE